MGEIFRLTDKAETKTLPCTHPGCENSVIVNKFFTPAKARCPEHQSAGRTPSAIAQMTSPAMAAPPSATLANLSCPEHPDVRMRVLSTASRFENGISIELQCSICKILVKISTSMNYDVKPKSYIGGTVWPDWEAWKKSRECACGHRIACFRIEDPIIAANDANDRIGNSEPTAESPKSAKRITRKG